MKDNLTEDDISEFIEIRSEPHIYAFCINNDTECLKVGYTFKTVQKRIAEWKKKYKKIKKVFPNNRFEGIAKVNKDIYFRDYSIHEYLKNNNYKNLSKEEFKKKFGDIYFSNEFFSGISVEDIKKGIEDIKLGYENNNPNYKYYKIKDREPSEYHWKNDKDWNLRDNQKDAVKKFKEKVKKQKELLMYAVMRFGKSFTALSCAKEINCKKILVVSAKADVANEWKKTVEMPKCFKKYRYLCDFDFVKNPNSIEDTINHKVEDEFKNKTRVVVFLTLQNLAGKDSDGRNIKKKLKKVISTEFDMIIIDETHFGAWSTVYGAPLSKEEDKEYINKMCIYNEKEQKKCEEKLKGKVKLHLSGTPYNLLYNEKFTDENIISTCQFSDILRDKEEWNKKHKKDIDEGKINPETGLKYEEYDNPYFGFPKMLRFAFNLPKKTQAKLEKLLKNGTMLSLNQFLETDKVDGNTRFLYEEDVLNLLKVIDGSKKDDSILSFLDIPKIRDNDVCKHIVMVLPYKYSCDAMENLLNDNEFKNLSKYNILNITGHNMKNELDDVEKVKNNIKEYEKDEQKTITLTVNKMLTGVTVPEWDTMIMLKDTNSPQEYDQAIFRIQSQYVKVGYDQTNHETLKIDMKPQTILVDFNPIRMLKFQGQSTRIVNKIEGEEEELINVLAKEVEVFPTIASNADKLVRVTPKNIFEIITNYNKNISILETSGKLEVDESLLENEDILNYVNMQSEKGISSKLTEKMYESDEESDFEIGVIDEKHNKSKQQEKTVETDKKLNSKSKVILKNKYKNCIAKLMFYAFLTKSNIESLSDILKSIENESIYQKENKRLCYNLKINIDFIKKHIELCKKQYAYNIDNAIANLNLLSKDENLSKEKRIKNALDRFSRISESEIVTPDYICNNMYNCIGKESLKEIVNNNGRILDIASKTGEFSVALFDLLKEEVDKEKIKNSIYCIPTSSITYELTRKIYEILEIPISHIACKFNTYQLLEVKKKNKKGKPSKKCDYEKICKILTQNKMFNKISLKDKMKKGGKNMNFDVIVGNPPYQENVGNVNSNRDLAKQIYPIFITMAININPKYMSFITPSRWFTGEGQNTSFPTLRKFIKENNHIKKIVSYGDNKEIFPNENIGCVNYFLYDKSYEGNVEFTEFIDGKSNSVNRPLFEKEMDEIIHLNILVNILNKVYRREDFKSLTTITTGRNPFKVPDTNEELNKVIFDKKDSTHNISIRCAKGIVKYTSKDIINRNEELVNKWKVYSSKMNGAAGTLMDSKQVSIIGKSYIGGPNSICSGALITFGNFDNETEAKNLQKYMETKFLRLMVGIMKSSRAIYQNVYKYVPLQKFLDDKEDIVWTDKSIHEIDLQLYKKYKFNDDEINYIENKIKDIE